MKINNPLTQILNSKVKVDCLRHLCNYSTELNGRELSRFLGITPKSIHKAMGSLVDEGVVNLSPHGNSFGYSIRKDKWIVKQLLLPLFQNERALLEEITDKIRSEIGSYAFRKNILSVSLFGSVQRKEDTNRSDFDIFILVDKEANVPIIEDGIHVIGEKLSRVYGVVIGPYIKSLASFKKDRSLNVIKSIMSSNRIIYGQELNKYGS